jgi:hypothetical protein
MLAFCFLAMGLLLRPDALGAADKIAETKGADKIAETKGADKIAKTKKQ